MKILKYLNWLPRVIINVIAVGYIVFDEIFVFISDKISNILNKYKIFLKLNVYIRALNKYILLLILVSLFGLSELIGIYSFMFLAAGNLHLFIVLYIVKFLPFFVVSYIFKCAKDILLEIKYFNNCYFKIVSLTDYLKNTAVILKAKEIKETIKYKFKDLLSQIKGI